MNEVEWGRSTEPLAMLNYLLDSRRATPRKLRLVAAGCTGQRLNSQRRRGAGAIPHEYSDQDGHVVVPMRPSLVKAFAAAGARELLALPPLQRAFEHVMWVLTLACEPGREETNRKSQADLIREVLGTCLGQFPGSTPRCSGGTTAWFGNWREPRTSIARSRKERWTPHASPFSPTPSRTPAAPTPRSCRISATKGTM